MSGAVFLAVRQSELDMVRNRRCRLDISFSPAAREGDYRLVVDIYSSGNPVHPQGHLGWWACRPPAGGAATHAVVSRRGGAFSVSFGKGARAGDSWVNPEFNGEGEPVLGVHLVLRDAANNSIAFEDVVSLYRDRGALESAHRRREKLGADLSGPARTSPRWFGWPTGCRVHLVARDVYERDAVGTMVISTRRLLKTGGVPCRIYACNFDPAHRGEIRHVADLFRAVRKRDVLVHFFSTYDPYLESISALECRKAVYYHGVTPPRTMRVFDAEGARRCEEALGQFGLLRAFDAWASTSPMACAELRERICAAAEAEGSPAGPAAAPEVLACPPFINHRRWDAVEEEPADLPDARDLLLYVGRLVPHKRVELLFEMFAEYSRLQPDSALVVAGRPAVGGYANYIGYLLEHRYSKLSERIRLTGELSDGQLKNAYRRSSCFVTLSEHEGYCVPLVEALGFDKPVFAAGQEAMCQTLGGSGVVFLDRDVAAAAAEIRRVLADDPERERIVRRQRARLAEIGEEADGRAVWRMLQATLESHARSV